MTNQNKPVPDPTWEYAEAWELIHEAMEIIVDTRKIMGETETVDKEKNLIIIDLLQKAIEKAVNCRSEVSNIFND